MTLLGWSGSARGGGAGGWFCCWARSCSTRPRSSVFAVEEVQRDAGGLGQAAEGDRLAAADASRCRPCSARACAAALLRAAAWRRLSGLPRISSSSVCLPVMAVGAGARRRRRARPGRCRRPAGSLFELDDDTAEGVVFLAASGQPDVVLAHRLSGAGLERLASLVDELVGAGQLGFQLGQEGRVGGELVAGQAGVALGADLTGRQQAPTVGQDPVGAPVQLEHVVEVARVDLEVARVGGDLAVAQELGLGGGLQGLRVGHASWSASDARGSAAPRATGRRRSAVGGHGVAESVGAVEVDQGAGAVAHVQPDGPVRSAASAVAPASRAGRRCGSSVPARNRYFGVRPGAPCSAKYRLRPLLLCAG